MRELTPTEAAHMKSFRDLLASEVIEIDFEKAGIVGNPLGGVPTFFEMLPEWDGVTLAPSLNECTLWMSELSCRWRTSGDLPQFGGEFRLEGVYDALLKNPPELGWEGSSQEEIEFFAQLRTIDGTPRSGAGLTTAIRVQKNVDPLEIWYCDKDLSRNPEHSLDYVKLGIDYCGYMHVLPLTKGTFGWQYLYTDVSLRGGTLQSVGEDLRNMLAVFPEIFPEYDYTELAGRLEARL
jgi:hypothetical protein